MISLSQLAVCVIALSIISADACPLPGCQQARKKRETLTTEEKKFIDNSAVVSENVDAKAESTSEVTKQEQITEASTKIASEAILEKNESSTETFTANAEAKISANGTLEQETNEDISEGFASVIRNGSESVEKKWKSVDDGLAEKKEEIKEEEKHEEVTIQSTADKSEEIDNNKNETMFKITSESEVEKKEETTPETILEEKMKVEMNNETISENVTEISQEPVTEKKVEMTSETVTEQGEKHSESSEVKIEDTTTTVGETEQKEEAKEQTKEESTHETTSTSQSVTEVVKEGGIQMAGDQKESHNEKTMVAEHESSGEEPISLTSVPPEFESILKADTDNILVTHFKGAATTCSSPELKALMHKKKCMTWSKLEEDGYGWLWLLEFQALTDDIESSKSALYDALHDYVPNGGFLIFCSEGRFSFKADAIEHCLVGNDKFNCYAFRA
uniref:Methyltranfer_dom domain-containing protein n=1 Tax=Syphacia muris TaxID=451379 RepID=A0A0N5AVD1_9BILA